MLDDNTGNVKFPGGGQEEQENNIETLVREVCEETGYLINIETIKEFMVIEEKRKSFKEEMIWHQLNYYYLCDLDTLEQKESNYSEHEKTLDLKVHWYELKEAQEKIIHFCKLNNLVCKKNREYVVLTKLLEKN